MEIEAAFPDKLAFLFEPCRYKVAWGGRGGAKSWGFARALLIQGTQRPIKVLCAREIQKSIADSVHALLKGQIRKLGLDGFYTVLDTRIYGKNGTEFIFAGLKHNVSNIKSVEDVDIVWVEEAQAVSKASWDVLIPTIRKPGSEIWVSFNPDLETDDTYTRFIAHPPTGSKIVKIGWQDNPWFSETTMPQERIDLLARDPDGYEHIWEGMCKQVVEGAVYRNELLLADKEGRICKVPYDATKPVHTFWDLGFADMTSIWFAQSVGFEFRLIDYLQGSQQALQYYLKKVQEKPYVYAMHHLPHDARAHQLGTGRSIEEQMRSAGFKVSIIPRLSVEDGIAAARAIFGRCYFDSENCADGLQCLRHYRYEKDDNLGTLKKQPLHDWASHGSDAFREFAVGMQEPQRQKQAAVQTPYYGESGWMA